MFFFNTKSVAIGMLAFALSVSFTDAAHAGNVVKVSVKRVAGPSRQPNPFWTDERVAQWVDEASEIFERNAQIQLQMVELRTLQDPGIPGSWFDVDNDDVTGMEDAALVDPDRFLWNPSAINVYLVNDLTDGGGICSLPEDNRHEEIIVVQPNILNSSIGLAHEFGHYFNLRHTFETASGVEGTGSCTEPSSNCATAGDLICDTPYDPGDLASLNILYAYDACSWNTLRFNIMSYYGGLNVGNATLTRDQSNRVQFALADYRQHVVAWAENVDCLNAESLFYLSNSVQSNSVQGSFCGAFQSGSSSCSGTYSINVWYRFVPVTDGTLEVNTCGTNDIFGVDEGLYTAVSLHSDCPGTYLNEIACDAPLGEYNCPDEEGFQGDAHVETHVEGGQQIYIRVTSASGEEGPFVLNTTFTSDAEVCATGNVNAGIGDVSRVLSINGDFGDPTNPQIRIPLNAPISIALQAAPAGPMVEARYAFWVWAGSSINPTELYLGGDLLGCMINPTPLHIGQAPQPFRCMRSDVEPDADCTGVVELSGPARAPFTLQRSRGFSRPSRFTMQAVLQDYGSAHPSDFSTTNAVILVVE